MNALIDIIGVLTVTAVTPGPNNLIVMDAAARRGARAAAMAIAGVIVGSVILYAFVALAWDEMSARVPLLLEVAPVLAAAYLAWLGVSLFRARIEAAESGTPDASKGSGALRFASPVGIAAFQFLNPKAWGLMAALAAGAYARIDEWLLVPVMIGVFATCLTVWAVGGVALSRHLNEARAARRFNRVMGASLVVFALSLVDFTAILT